MERLKIGSRNVRRYDDVPSWFGELTSLRRFEVYLASVGDWALQLSAMSLESVNFQVDHMGQDEEEFGYSLGHMFLQDDDNWEDDDSVGRDFFADHVATLPLTRLGESLREIHLTGYDGFTRVPECLLRLPHLQHLDLSGNFDLGHLPDDIALLPLVVLDLNWTGIETLPLSLQTMTTLRILDLSATRLGADVEGAPIRAADIARRDAILRPLSLAIPDLRFSLHSCQAGFTFQQGARMHWWHLKQ